MELWCICSLFSRFLVLHFYSKNNNITPNELVQWSFLWNVNENVWTLQHPKTPRWQHRRESFPVDVRLAPIFWMKGSLGPTSRGSEDQNHTFPVSVTVLVFTESRKRKGRECAACLRVALWPPANNPEKAAFGRNSDAAWLNIKRCLSLRLLHLSPSSERWNIIPLRHLTGIQHVERWSLPSHARPWNFHKRGKRDHECLKLPWQRISHRCIWKLGWRNNKKKKKSHCRKSVGGDRILLTEDISV